MVPQQPRRRRRRAPIARTSERRVVVARGVGGFGFTIAGQRPCVVSAVAAGGPADRAGLRAGDALLAVDGASVVRAPHASVARLVAGAPAAIALSVSPRETAPTDTEDTEPDERARTRRRHPPPRRRPQPTMHHPGCHAAPSTSGVNEILQNLSMAQLTPSNAARLECRTVVGYLGTIETPQAANNTAPGNVRTAVRKLRQERRSAAPVLLSVLPNSLVLRRPSGQVLAQYQRERIVYAGCGSDADRRYFGLVTSAETAEADSSHSCHVFAVDPRMAEHEAHITRAREFQIACTRDPVAERCLEFPPSAEYVVGVIRGMYSLPAEDCSSPHLQQISKLAIKGDSPAIGNFSRCNRPVFRVPRDRRPCRHEDARPEAQDFVANSPQPSNHSEITTTSSNSDSGIGFHNDGRNIADRILVVDFAGAQPAPNRFRQDMPRRPVGLVGCSSFEADGSFLSNTTPVVDGFGGQGRPLNLDDVILNANDMQVRHVSPRTEEDNYNYNNVYGNLPQSNGPSTSRYTNGAVYDQVYTENEGHYEFIPPQLDMDLEIDQVTETFNFVEIYEESRSRHPPDWQSNESVENITVISGGTSKASADSVSVYSSRSHEEARPQLRKHLQASLDDMLVLGLRKSPAKENKDDDVFVHPSTVKCKTRKSMKPLNLISKTKHILSGKDRDNKSARRRAISASAGDVCGGDRSDDTVVAAASEPDLRDTQSEQSSPFRRWTTSSGGSSYRHHDHRSMYNKQMSEGSPVVPAASSGSSVARWSLGLDQLLADPAGAAAFAEFLHKQYAAENIRFWLSCEEYKSLPADARSAKAADIWKRHLGERASDPVNVDAAARYAAAHRMCHDPPPIDLFDQAQTHIFDVMKLDAYPRFLRSAEHGACARAELRGEPLACRLGNDRGDHDTDTTTKLKKSVSNASDRRRSGGASLLPWRFRPASRERNNDTSQQPPKPGLCGGQCRVVFPDGSTSVVRAEGAVGTLVERLLLRRQLPHQHYDVLLKDPKQGESATVDLQTPASTLSGREIVVERRAMVRLELNNVSNGGAARCVVVRCGGARPLAHVLRRVGARYGLPPARAVLRGRVLHPGTMMQELDGCVLQVVETADEATARTESDGDSLSDLALRLQDDQDNESQSTISGSSACSRVRAALHPGPDKHLPPNFLNDLRQRIQKDTNPVRSPPPLPPKPAPRGPSRV